MFNTMLQRAEGDCRLLQPFCLAVKITAPWGVGKGNQHLLVLPAHAVHDDGKVTIWLKGYDYPITIRAEHLSLVAKRTSKRDA